MNQISDDNEQEVETYANMVTELEGTEATTLEEVKHETEKVSYCMQKINNAVKTNEPYEKDSHVEAYVSVISEFWVINGLLLRGERLVIPKSLRQRVVDAAHEEHQGITKTKSFLRSRTWFPRMDAMVEKTVRHCIACQVSTPQT